MDLKNFVRTHWRWMALLAALVAVGALVSWEGSALTALLWFSSKQAKKIKDSRREVRQEAEEVSEAIEAESDRQEEADVSIEVDAQAARETVGDEWDDVDIQTAPRLDI